MSEHVLYEIELCASALYALVTDARTSERDFPPLTIEYGRGNAVIEAFLLHVRVLDDFFRERGSRDSDVLALDFVGDPEDWKLALESCPSPPISARERINRGIAHLSWHRVHEGAIPGYDASMKLQAWEPYQLWDTMKPRIRRFLELADSAGLCDQFAQRAEAALVLI
jgi:hypothetical protein